RSLGAGDGEVDAAADAVARALAHPLLRRAAASSRCLREFPVIVEAGAGRLVEGAVDLAFLEGEVWHVVDFKTDAPTEAHERQIAWYVYAMARITGRGAVGWLLSL
ncbi:MAG: hypothetical protein ACRD96_22690, partial [Bryobacteraceae bacterium]